MTIPFEAGAGSRGERSGGAPPLCGSHQPAPAAPARLGEEWREAPAPVRVLIACGWLTPSAASDPGLLIQSSSSSHTLYRVTAPDGRSAIVKQVPQEAARRGRRLAKEMFLYRLCNWIPEIASVVPHPIFIDERRQVVVLDSLSDNPVWPAPEDMAPLSGKGVAAALGTAMGTWHRATEALAAWPSPAPGILGLPDSLDEATLDRPETTRHLMGAIAADRLLSRALLDIRSRYVCRCLIHGDLRRENWLRDRRSAFPALRIIDWELSGLGDPAWDVGSAIAEALVEQIQDHRVLTPGTGIWPAEIAPTIRDFYAAYRKKGGPVDLGERRCADMVALCAAARLLHIACECADMSLKLESWPVSELILWGRRISGGRHAASGQLKKWAGS